MGAEAKVGLLKSGERRHPSQKRLTRTNVHIVTLVAGLVFVKVRIRDFAHPFRQALRQQGAHSATMKVSSTLCLLGLGFAQEGSWTYLANDA